MRNSILAAVMFFAAISTASAVADPWGSNRPAIWRSTEICHAAGFVVVASSAAIVHSVQITSATVIGRSDDVYTTYNSSASADAKGGGIASSTMTRTYTWVPPGNPVTQQPFVYDEPHARGITINKIGDGCVDLRWDYQTPRKEPLVPHLGLNE